MAHLDTATRDADSRSGCVQSLVRALALLDELAEHDAGLTLTEAARRVELPRSTAHRLLTTMESMRYVAFDSASSHWTVGVRAFAVGGAVEEDRDIGRLARPILQSLLVGARATASVAAPAGRDIRCVARACATDDRTLPGGPGERLPIHTTALGKVIMAHWSETELETFLQGVTSAGRGGVDPAALRAELQVIRRRGYAIDDGQMRRDVRSVAAAVFDRRGQVRAAIAVSAPMERAPDARLPMLGAMVQASARQMSEGFGFAIAA